jgi:hypothetical protein
LGLRRKINVRFHQAIGCALGRKAILHNCRWKALNIIRLNSQVDALAELETMELKIAEAWRIKEMLRWVRCAPSLHAAK